MNVKNDISEELRSLSELVATISRQTPYRVADDYFADFPTRALLRIKALNKPLTFNVPDGYFEGFAETVLARIRSGAENQTGVPSSRAVPENAEAEIAALSPLLAQLRVLETYRLPEGYFEELSPILTLVKDRNPYTVPEEYFHGFPATVHENLPQERPGRVVSLGSRRNSGWKYAAAAVVAGLILTVGWLRWPITGGHHRSVDIAARLPKASDEELQSWLAELDTTLAQPTSNFATADVSAFTEGDLKNLLGEVPDGELKQYMEDHGGANVIATN